MSSEPRLQCVIVSPVGTAQLCLEARGINQAHTTGRTKERTMYDAKTAVPVLRHRSMTTLVQSFHTPALKMAQHHAKACLSMRLGSQSERAYRRAVLEELFFRTGERDLVVKPLGWTEVVS